MRSISEARPVAQVATLAATLTLMMTRRIWQDFRETALMLAFTGTAASVVVMSRAQDGRGRWASRTVTASAALVVIVIAIGMASGEEPGWFFAAVGRRW